MTSAQDSDPNAGARRPFRIASVLVALYALVSLASTAATHRAAPSFAVVGLHAQEIDPATGRPFRWSSGTEAQIRAPIAGAALHLPVMVSRPGPLDAPIEVRLRVDGEPVDETLFVTSGWSEVTTFLPPLLGPERWERVVRAWAELEARNGPDPPRLLVADRWRPAVGRSPRQGAVVRTLWKQATRPAWPLSGPRGPADLPWVQIELRSDSAFVPASLDSSSGDYRRLGFAVGQPRWTDRVRSGGIGFHDWEQDLEGRRFRWTGRTASIGVRARPGALEIPVRSDDPDLAARPLTVDAFWNDLHLGSTRLDTAEWRAWRLEAGFAEPGTVGVLTLKVDRPWNPALAVDDTRRSGDARYLGVAVGVHRWLPRDGSR